MRPVVVSAILSLVALTYVLSASGNAYIAQVCETNYPVTVCGTTDWHRLDDKRCMKFTTNRMTFSEAEKHCESESAELVSIHNLKQYDKLLCYVFRLYKAVRTKMWIGARREKGRFFWVDGSGDMTFSRWYGGKPNNSLFNEHCVEMSHVGWGRWNDISCSAKRRFVCAKKM